MLTTAPSSETRQWRVSKIVFLGRRLLNVYRHVIECDFAVGIGHGIHYVVTTGRLGPRLISYHLGWNPETGTVWHPVGLEFARTHSERAQSRRFHHVHYRHFGGRAVFTGLRIVAHL